MRVLEQHRRVWCGQPGPPTLARMPASSEHVRGVLMNDAQQLSETGSQAPTDGKSATRSERQQQHRRRIGREPVLVPPLEVLLRYKARLLDPLTAVLLPHQRVWPTVYLADRLLVTADPENSATWDTLAAAAQAHGLWLRKNEHDLALADQLSAGRRDGEMRRVAVRVKLVPSGKRAAGGVDAWAVLQTYRSEVGEDERRRQVDLDHLVTATTDISGVPFAGGHGIGGVPFAGGHGVGDASAQYGVPGLGGRTPVMWIGAEPHRTVDDEMPCRRPVVVILDTAVGSHPWLPESIVDRHPRVRGERIGTRIGGGAGFDEDPFEGVLDTDAGHGTFIAGLIRQMCPDANIVSVQVMRTSGAVPEGDLLHALWQIVRRQEDASAPGGDRSQLIDVVSLSLGYYHEQPQDALFDSKLLDPIEALSCMGVPVIASAGNNATDRLMYPAAFTPFDAGVVRHPQRDRVPVISVGALNPNRTIALFSNAGPWVKTYRPGSAVVSTMPITLDGGAQPSYEVTEPAYGARANIDPDNFYGGFASWSGTSFAAPILAGQIAQSMLDANKRHPLDAVDIASSLSRGWAAVAKQTGVRRP
jgi:Subtilase family